MNKRGTLTLQTIHGTGLRFGARFASGRETTFDSGEGARAPDPMEMLLGSLAACTAMDVISILRKKRLDVSAYEVEIEGTRAAAHPKRYLAMTLVHRVTGHGVPEAAVEEAVRLSAERYCSVHHSLDPALPIASRIEVREG